MTTSNSINVNPLVLADFIWPTLTEVHDSNDARRRRLICGTFITESVDRENKTATTRQMIANRYFNQAYEGYRDLKPLSPARKLSHGLRLLAAGIESVRLVRE
jgi:hypothetical protein